MNLDLGNLLVHLRLTDDFTRKAEGILRTNGRKLETFGRNATLYLTAPLVAFGAAATKAFASFDDAMTKSLAIMSGITPQLRKQLGDVATAISKDTVTSATDLAKGYFYLASAGYDAQQSMKLLSTVNDFAIAGSFDLSTATTLAADAQKALGLAVKDATQNQKNLTHVTDVLTGANTLANANIEQFSKALTTEAAAAMRFYNIRLEEGVGVLAAYAEQGKKGEEAGSLFGRMLRLTLQGFREQEDAWRQFNINIYDATGNLKPLADIIEMLSRSLQGMSTKQKVAALDMLGFKARSQQAVTPLLGMQDAVREYVKRLDEMGGTTKHVAEENMSSFSAQLKISWNNLVALSKVLGERVAPYIVMFGEYIKNISNAFMGLSENTQQLIVEFGLIVAVVGPLSTIAGKLILGFIGVTKALFTTVTAANLLGATFASVFVAIAAFKLGNYFYNEFKSVAVFARELATTLLVVWERIKLAWRDLTAYMLNVWEVFIAKVGVETAVKIGKISSVFGLLGIGVTVSIKKALEDLAEGAVDSTKTLEATLAENQKIYEQNFTAILQAADAFSRELDEKFGNKPNSVVTTPPTGYEPTKLPDMQNAFGHLTELANSVDLSGEQIDRIMDKLYSGLNQYSGDYFKLQSNRLNNEIALWRRNSQKIAEAYNMEEQGVEDLIKAYEEEQQRLIEIERLKKGSWSDGFKAFAMEAQATFKTAGEKAYEFAQTMEDSIARGLENISKDMSNWKDSMVDMLKEIYFAAIRIAFIQPAAQGLAGGLSAFGSALFSGGKDNTGGNVSGAGANGAPKKYASGGVAWHKQLAVVAENEPEVITPISQLGGMGSKTTVNVINQSGVPLEVGKEQEYMMSDQRIIDVVVGAAGINGNYRRAHGLG